MRLLFYNLTSHKHEGVVIRNCQVCCQSNGEYYFANVTYHDHPEEALWKALLLLPDIIAAGPVK